MKTHFCFQRSFSLIFFIAILLCENVNAKNYYFSSSTGNDSYTSLQAQNPLTPWQTLGKLNSFFSSLIPGDSVLLKRGDVFVGNIYLNHIQSGRFSRFSHSHWCLRYWCKSSNYRVNYCFIMDKYQWKYLGNYKSCIIVK